MASVMTEYARVQIQTNLRTRAPFLDLGNCGLFDVPGEVAELTWLRGISFGGSWQIFGSDGAVVGAMRSRNEGRATVTLGDVQPLLRLPELEALYFGGLNSFDLRAVAQIPRLRKLDISCALIGDLTPLQDSTTLEELICNFVDVADLGPIGRMRQLRGLALAPRGAMVRPLKPSAMRDTLLGNLSPLAGATNLTWLRLSYLPWRELDDLRSLRNLRGLWIKNCPIEDLAALSDMSDLRQLQLSGTLISGVESLQALTSLEGADFSYTGVAAVEPLASMTRLRSLDLRYTKVRDLAPLQPQMEADLEIRLDKPFEGAPGIFVDGCPLESPPLELVQQGRAAVLNYLSERGGGDKVRLYEAKVLILGEGESGKTSLLRRLFAPGQPLPAPDQTTRGIAIHRHDFKRPDGSAFRLNVWDFGGQEIYHATHQFFLTRRSVYVLVADTRTGHGTDSDPGFHYWLELIDLFSEHSPVLIFQNEKGGRSKDIDLAAIKGRFANVKDRYAGDLIRPDAADRLRDAIEFEAMHLPHVGELLPVRWLDVRAELERRAAEEPYISLAAYQRIYARFLPADRVRALYLSRYLHDIGACLHFQDDALLARIVILRNAWVTDAVFRIIDDESIKARRGHFTGADAQRLWNEPHYADMHPELLALMQRFELCFQLPDSQPPTWLVPQLLPASPPTSLETWPQPRDLQLRVSYGFMPKGLIPRLIVRLHRLLPDAARAWSTGALFARPADSPEGSPTELLVSLRRPERQDKLSQPCDEIELRAQGPERKELMSVVAGALDALNESVPGLREKVDKRVPCICVECVQSSAPHFFMQSDLLRRREHQKHQVECKLSYEMVDVQELLDGIPSGVSPAWGTAPRPAMLPRTVKIFLASSSELAAERDEFDLYFRQQNDHWIRRGLYLKIRRWEDFLDAISETRQQDEYNEAIRESEIFIALFRTKCGKYTEEEFNVAHEHFLAKQRPRIFVFFHDDKAKLGAASREDIQSLWAFQDKLKALGHYLTTFETVDALKLQFRTQLDLLQEEWEMSGGP